MFTYNDLSKISREINSESFYIWDRDKFIDNYNRLSESFISRNINYKLAYSFKTNYCPAVVSLVNELGGVAEIVSSMEYEIAQKAGFSKKNIIFNGPVKHIQASIDLLDNGGVVIIDNMEELKELVSRKCNSSNIWNVGIRCNLDMGKSKFSRFGFDVYSEEFKEVIKLVEDNFKLKILHCHMGGYRELEYWKKRVDELAEIYSKFTEKPEIIDLGSGMFGEMEESFKSQFNKVVPTFDEYADCICNAFKIGFSSKDGKLPILMTEPGTTIVANTMKFYCPVTSIKNIRGKYFIEVMGSIHNIGTELASKKNLPFTLVPSDNMVRQNVVNADIVGYTCLEYDSLQRGVEGSFAVGDYCEFRNVGSYSNVIKPPFILPNFPMITVVDGNIDVIKRKEENSDIYRTYIFH